MSTPDRDTTPALGAAAGAGSNMPLLAWAGTPVGTALLVVLATAVANADGMRFLFDRWLEYANESHGLVIAALVPYFVWSRRGELTADGRGRGIALLLLLSLQCLLAVAWAAGVDAPALALLPATALAAVGVALGFGAARVLAFPIGCFLLAVPVWDVFTPTLQALTVDASTFLLFVAGVPAHIDGNLISIPAGTFEVVGGCSGTNYFVVALAFASVLAFQERLTPVAAGKLIALALGAAILGNWVRVTAIVYAGHATAMQASIVEKHATFGWAVFATAMLPVFWYAVRVRGARAIRRARGERTARSPKWSFIAMACVFIASAAHWVELRRPAAPRALPTLHVDGWATVAPLGDWRPDFPGAALVRLEALGRGSSIVDVYAAGYGRQERGAELVGFSSRIEGAQGWRVAAHRVTETGRAHAGDSPVIESMLERQGQRRLVWWRYHVRGRVEVTPWRVKLLEGLAAFGARRDSGVLAISAPCRPDCAAARELLAEFMLAGALAPAALEGPR